MREEFLELLRSDQAFRKELRRQLLTELLAQALSLLRETVGAVHSLTEAQRRTEGGQQQLGERVQALMAAQLRTEEGLQRQGAQIQAFIEAQERTEGALYRTQEELRELANWQRGDVERRDGEWGG